ncbi:CHAT domain-containing tetratricopeptide repeat protein [Frigoriglobus tundricola]|uniref:CHAT domain-containing protein n=1 Tax=Frigoriglobus tundricola TaxID=2774151 RepID=A0A6M5Z5R0_9BACT|nr:tetratricopeptide repeat protein [Frigoriglobus tundricola]QJX00764.1 hypothetical protein FTUN_8402 [Frigoriglobus tundricola]
MIRFRSLVISALIGSSLPVPVTADDPPKRLTDEERKDLDDQRLKWNRVGLEASEKRQYPDAVKAYEKALEIAHRLYPMTEFPNGHAKLSNSLSNLALTYYAHEKYEAAEPLFKDALEMRKRLFQGDHPSVADSLNDLAGMYNAQRRYGAAEPLFKAALDMRRRLFRGDHAGVANSLNNLAALYNAQKKYGAAEPLFKEALDMHRRLYKGDHPGVATSLNNLAFFYRDQGKDGAAEPLFKEALDMYKRLDKGDRLELTNGIDYLALLYRDQGKYAAAEPLFKEVLDMRKRLYKGDHPDVATSLNNLALLHRAQGNYAAAEPLFKAALDMRKRLFKGDHPGVANSLTSLALVYRDQGKYAAAEPLFKEALDMHKRVFRGDHPGVANSLNNLALMYNAQEKREVAEALFKDALEMHKRLFPGDHPSVANSLNNLAGLYRDQGKYATAEVLFKDALEMYKRLFPGDHPSVANSLNNLAGLYRDQGKYGSAEPLLTGALEMHKRLFPGDHPALINSLSNLAVLHQAQAEYAAAEPLFKDALAMSQRITAAHAKQKTEGEALTFTASLPLYRDGFLSFATHWKHVPASTYDPATAYPTLWTTKGTLARVYEQRQFRVRTAAIDPALARTLSRLGDVRRRRAEILFAPATTDAVTLEHRAADLSAFDSTIAELTKALTEQFPPTARADKLATATPADLHTALSVGTAFVDFYHYTYFERDDTQPAGKREKRTNRYVAFVVTRDKVTWVDLGAAVPIGEAVRVWREGITGHKEIPNAVAQRVRELVWEPVRKHLPGAVRTVYICLDADLFGVPFAALPGDRAGTIVLEDFAIATIPHPPFLLDKLWPHEPVKNPPSGALVVGGVKYDAEIVPPGPNVIATRSGAPLLKPGQKLDWPYLPGSAVEANGVSAAAERKQLLATRLDGDKATPATVLAALPKARHAHFATHGFFADASFRSVFQLDEKDYEISRGGERIGRAVNSPLIMSGLVFAGANNPKTPGRGVVTGEQLIDLDLSGLELAVLSACETGLGAVAGGEGVYGLQRAFHYAGATNVVASLWKVPDQSTAALMALFYRNLWERNMTPLESLRQAQLEIYRYPEKVPELAKGFRGEFEIVPGAEAVSEIKPNKDGKAHPLFWAAFTLSGPGR